MQRSSPLTPPFLSHPENHGHLKGFYFFSLSSVLFCNIQETSARKETGLGHQVQGSTSRAEGDRPHGISIRRLQAWAAQRGSSGTMPYPCQQGENHRLSSVLCLSAFVQGAGALCHWHLGT